MIENEVVVRIIDLPHSVMGFTSPSPDGAYNIYLNARHSREEQEKTYRHELAHIKNGDFQSDRPVREIELTCRKAE